MEACAFGNRIVSGISALRLLSKLAEYKEPGILMRVCHALFSI